MKAKENNIDQLLKETLEYIKRAAPSIKDLSINFTKEKDGEYNTRLEARVKKRKRIVAEKKGHSIHESLGRSRQALLKQVEKILNKPLRLHLSEVLITPN
jgi:hypothetical protein